MMTEYYTPTQDEFHVGFEYEILAEILDVAKNDSEQRWIKMIIPDDNLKFVFHMDRISYLSPEKLRVKKLDEEDVISLDYTKHDGDSFFKKQTNECVTHIQLMSNKNEEPICQVQHWTFEGENKNELTLYSIFSGHIRNKSELKRILFQLTNKKS